MIQDTQNNQTSEKMTIEDLAVIVLSVDKKIDNFDKKFDSLDEKFVTNDRFERSMTAIANSFNQVYEEIHQMQNSIQILGDTMSREFALTREENREFRQHREQLYRTEIIHERKIDELDTRVLKLETAR